jgi:hypothetical protein
MADGERGRSVFFFFEFFCKLNLIFKQPQKRRPKFKFNGVTSKISKDRKKKKSKNSKDWRWIMHIQTQLPTACNKWAWRIGGGCECCEVKMWLNPLLLFNLRWRILKSNENSLVKKTWSRQNVGGLFGPFISQAMGGGCESGEVKIWLNPLLIFDLRWRIPKTNES